MSTVEKCSSFSCEALRIWECNKRKLRVIKYVKSCIKENNQLLNYFFQDYNSNDLSSNQQGGRLEDLNQELITFLMKKIKKISRRVRTIRVSSDLITISELPFED